MRILVLNGPNLNMLNKRDEYQYGEMDLQDIEELIKSEYPSIEFEFHQSNHEGGLVDLIQNAETYFNGILINPAGFSHTSVAIRDALELCKLPKIEVHLSNLSSREDYRQKLVTASAVNGYISGFKEKSYLAGIYLLKKLINETT